MKKIIYIIILLFTVANARAQYSYCTPMSFLDPAVGCTNHYANINSLSLPGGSGYLYDTLGCSGTGYEDRTGMSCTLYQGHVYAVTVATGSTLYTNCQVWVDFNENWVFDVSEAVGGLNYFIGGGNTFLITIPSVVSVGTFTMRVAFNDTSGAEYPDIDPCLSTAGYRDVRDYTINITNTPPTASSDSFNVTLNSLCSSPSFSVQTNHYHTGMSVKTWFGDGTSSAASVISSGGGGAIPTFTHAYSTSGVYSVKQVLYMSGLAVDSLSLSCNYLHCTSLPVRFYYDNNFNCIKDSNESYNYDLIKTEVDSNGVPIDTIMATSGFYYSALGNPGDVYAFKIIYLPSFLITTCPSSGILYDTLGSGSTGAATNYFAIACTTTPSFDLKITEEIPVTGVMDQWGNIQASNATCTPTDADITVYFSPKYVYTGGASPSPSATTATSITWHATALRNGTPTNLFYELWENEVTGLLIPGDTVHTYVTISPTTGDIDTSNNHNIIIDTVKAGCDPNEMFVSPAGCIAFPSPSPTTTLQYTIDFMNTGNDTAHNIYVMDTLSDKVDPTTISNLSSTAAMFITVLHSAGHTILKFDMPHINLLDSSHHNACTGNVAFSINTLSGLLFGDVIDNRAGIYFDYNDVVMTNTVENTIGCPVATEVPQNKATVLDLYPNPATNELDIKTSGSSYSSFTITNAVGQEVMKGQLKSAITRLDVNSFAPGLYYMTVRGTDGVQVRKWLKQ